MKQLLPASECFGSCSFPLSHTHALPSHASSAPRGVYPSTAGTLIHTNTCMPGAAIPVDCYIVWPELPMKGDKRCVVSCPHCYCCVYVFQNQVLFIQPRRSCSPCCLRNLYILLRADRCFISSTPLVPPRPVLSHPIPSRRVLSGLVSWFLNILHIYNIHNIFYIYI